MLVLKNPSDAKLPYDLRSQPDAPNVSLCSNGPVDAAPCSSTCPLRLSSAETSCPPNSVASPAALSMLPKRASLVPGRLPRFFNACTVSDQSDAIDQSPRK